MTTLLIEDDLSRLTTAGYILRKRAETPRFSPKAAALMFETFLQIEGFDKTYNVYDPFCGNGTILAILQLGYSSWVDCFFGSDVNTGPLQIAQFNLDYLNVSGRIDDRISQLIQEEEITGKESTCDRIRDAKRLKQYLEQHPNLAPYYLFSANTLNPEDLSRSLYKPIDLVLTDPPYSKDCLWVDERGNNVQANLIYESLHNLRAHLSDRGKMIVIFDKKVRLEFAEFEVQRIVPLEKRTGYLLSPK